MSESRTVAPLAESLGALSALPRESAEERPSAPNSDLLGFTVHEAGSAETAAHRSHHSHHSHHSHYSSR